MHRGFTVVSLAIAAVAAGCGGSDTPTVVTETVTVSPEAEAASASPAEPDPREFIFFLGLDAGKVPYSSKSTAVDQAKGLCAWYRTTNEPFLMGALQVVMRTNPTFTLEQASGFAGAATSAFCEEYGPNA